MRLDPRAYAAAAGSKRTYRIQCYSMDRAPARLADAGCRACSGAPPGILLLAGRRIIRYTITAYHGIVCPARHRCESRRHSGAQVVNSQRRPPMERTPGTLRAELATFLLLTFGLSTGFYIFFAHAKTLNVAGGLFVGMLMWCPGVSALVTRLIFQRNVRGEGWAWAPSRYELAGYLLPIAYAACAYAAVWIFDFGRVDLARFKTNPL